jgi:hypothetical protein
LLKLVFKNLEFLPEFSVIQTPTLDHRSLVGVWISLFTINSLQAQRVVDRVFRRTVSSLYGINVILRIIGDENEIDEVEQIISQLIEYCSKVVGNEQARLDKLMCHIKVPVPVNCLDFFF